MSKPTALTPDQILAEKRPEHEPVKIGGKTVCRNCWNVAGPKGFRLRCRRKMTTGFGAG
jgi:hypothetical protein